MGQRITEYLEIEDVSGKPMVQCRKCKHIFCPATENYKYHALVSENPPNRAGPKHRGSGRFVLREFYCPQCATMMDVEMCLQGAPFIWDTQLKHKS